MKVRLFRLLHSVLLLTLLLSLTNLPSVAQVPQRLSLQPSGPTWTQKTPASSPLGMGGATMVYDTVRRRSILWTLNASGTASETWEYDGTNWSRKVTASTPSPRGLPKAAYDSARQRVVLFGGIYSPSPTDTWEYDGSNWMQKVTVNSPPPRYSHAMAYDASRSRIVLFGGMGPQGEMNDTWEYDGIDWVRKSPSTSPPVNWAHRMAYDSTNKRVVLFGGNGPGSGTNETWEYNGSTWIRKGMAQSPSSRISFDMAYDSARERIVLFGGRDVTTTPGRVLNDTWEYDGISWVQVNPSASPSPRLGHSMAYDADHQRIVLFGGGKDDEDMSNETWEYGSVAGGSPRLEITKVEFNPVSPTTFQQVDVKLTIENKGTTAYLPVWNYTGRLTLSGGSNTREIDFDEGHDSVLLLENPRDPFRVNQKWILTIHASFWDAVSNGRMQITLQPKGLGSSTPSLPALQTSQMLSVREDLNPFVTCSAAIAKTFAGALGPVGKCVLHQYISDVSAVQCKDRLCQAKAYAFGLVKCAVKPVSIVAGIKDTFDSKELEDRARDCYTPLLWAGDLVRDLIGRGIHINFFGIHSPATLLISDQTGRRTGILDNGTTVQEIPDSWVIIDGEEKYVMYHGTNPVTLRVKGTGTGTMRVEMTTSDGNDAGRSITYDAVPVNPNMIAEVVTTDGQAILNIDNNGDGQVDQSKKPDTMAAVAPMGRTFLETERSVSGKFWTAWQGSRSYEDSLYINGLPLTDRRPEVNPTDGKTYETQWFERARFEYHPGNQAPNDVLLGLMGVHAAQGRQGEEPFKPMPDPGNGLDWFKDTGHTLGDTSEGGQAIALFWRRLGGLAQFGYPLSQPFMEVNKENAKSYLVQYFERQRFEYHPENKGTRYEVLLGRLGAEQLNEK